MSAKEENMEIASFYLKVVLLHSQTSTTVNHLQMKDGTAVTSLNAFL